MFRVREIIPVNSLRLRKCFEITKSLEERINFIIIYWMRAL